MNRFSVLGMAWLTAVGSIACGDATPPEALGSGGSNVLTGKAGSAGSATAGSAGEGSGGSAGAPGGDAGGAPCSGCVELVVPVDGGVQNTMFNFALPSAVDMSAAVITYRVRALTLGAELHANPFAQDEDYGGFPNSPEPLSADNGFVDEETWVDLSFDLAAIPAAPLLGGSDAGGRQPDPAAFDRSAVKQFGLHVGTGGAFAGDLSVRVLVDSVTFSGVDDSVLPDITFSSDAEGLTINSYGPRPGSAVIHHP